MTVKLRSLLALTRPRQLYKLGIIWLPGLFHGEGSLQLHLRTLILASCAWWLCASIVYIINDIRDLPQDRQRPDRCHRPLAKGDLTPRAGLMFAAALLSALLLVLPHLDRRASILLGAYGLVNLGYTLGLKNSLGIRQLLIAVGFWFRLQTGAIPVTSIPLSPWASLFTLGLAYYLNCLKGQTAARHDRLIGLRFAMAMGAGLAGSLALVSLVSICLKRGLDRGSYAV